MVTFLIIALCILLLIAFITWLKFNPFLSLLLVSLIGGILFGIPLGAISSSIQKGIGDTLGSLVIVIVLGGMLGKLVAESGAAKVISTSLMKVFGEKYIRWGMMVTGFVVGIPLFYNVGFVLMVPLIFSVVYQYKLPAVYLGLPMLASLSVTHGFLPPHPSPVALIAQFHANLGKTLLLGILIAIPAVIIAGIWYSRSLIDLDVKPMELFAAEETGRYRHPGMAISYFTALLPVILLALGSILNGIDSAKFFFGKGLTFLSDPSLVMLISLLFAIWALGPAVGRPIKEVMRIGQEAVKDIAMILLIIAGSGALKQVLVDSGVSHTLGETLQGLKLHPLILAWLIAAIIRVALGSATIAGLTAAAIITPMMSHTQVEPALMVLSIGAGSLFFSHVNDAGFWLFKEYFNLSVKQTIRSWSMMETIVAVVGLAGVLVLNFIIH